MRAGRAAGMICIAVPGPCTPLSLGADCDVLLPDVSFLASWLSQPEDAPVHVYC